MRERLLRTPVWLVAVMPVLIGLAPVLGFIALAKISLSMGVAAAPTFVGGGQP